MTAFVAELTHVPTQTAPFGVSSNLWHCVIVPSLTVHHRERHWGLGGDRALALDGAGFHVDIEVLETASKAMGAIADKQDKSELADLCDGDAQAVGSDVMCEALVSFCEKMSEGIDYLVDKAEDTREGLNQAAQTYRETERTIKDHLAGDPAAAAMDDFF